MSTTLEEYMEGVINVFHRYSVRVGDFDTLTKGELKQLITRELPKTLQNSKDKASIEKLFQELDTDRDGQISFGEFMKLLVQVLVTAHNHIHQE
ncbi:protein S100-A12 [Loxodonta africana]|uniref:protein S100-A12 n=1 Tax=Loxodonta africana TaxID=9785 RepID=UPI0000E3590D|nr:protein S100-A12 [Loxodonta africana]XP_049736473.1 protein S100-A12 [Elephas maximus indicus]